MIATNRWRADRLEVRIAYSKRRFYAL